MIAGLATLSEKAGADSLVWLPSQDRDFNVKFAHYAIAHLDRISTDPLFKLIWKWKGLERIKLFLWLTAHNTLHTNAFRHSMHISPSPDCTCCNEGVHESVNHSLRDCSLLGDFWHQLVPNNRWVKFFTAPLKHWSSMNLASGWRIEGHKWSLVFGSAIHFLWKIRNEELFLHLTPSLDHILEQF